MSAPIVHKFRGCELRIWPEQEHVATVFRDGAVAPASRECELQNLSYARHLGYPDCWRAVVTHEAAHTHISERLGHLFSPTLHAVANGYMEGTAPYEMRLYEEALVLSIERFMNTGTVLPILRHPEVRPHFSLWARELRNIVRNLLDTPDKAA